MNRTTGLTLILCVSISCSVASGQGKPATFAVAAPSTFEPQPAPSVSDPAKAVVSVVNPEAKRSEVVLGIVDALEKSGIERSDAPADQNWNDDRITARIRIRLDTTCEKITALVKAMRYAGVRKFSLTNPTVDGKNMLFLVANTPQLRNDIERIEQAAKHAAEQSDLTVDVISTIPTAADARVTNGDAHRSTAGATTPFSESAARFAQPRPLNNPYNNSPQLPKLSVPKSSTIAPEVLSNQIKQLSREYNDSNNQALELAESLSRTPDPKREAELRSSVANALRARQDLLQAELQQMQYRLNQTQADLMRRKQIRSQIVDRRVSDLLNPQVNWEGSKLIHAPKESQPNAALAQGTLRNPTSYAPGISAETELEGDWHQIAYSDGESDAHEKHIYNRTFRGNLSVQMWATGSEENRIEVDAKAKTIRSFTGNNGSYSEEQYELQGDRLVIVEPGFIEGDRITVYERGIVPFVEITPPQLSVPDTQ